MFGNNPPQMVPMDLNFGFQGVALIQGQIYNPVYFVWNTHEIYACGKKIKLMFDWTCEQCKKPGCLGYIGDYTTQLRKD